MYSRLRDQVTSKGFTFDQMIQCGVDNPGKKGTKEGKTIGIVAGDEESYEVYQEQKKSVKTLKGALMNKKQFKVF